MPGGGVLVGPAYPQGQILIVASAGDLQAGGQALVILTIGQR